MESGRGEEEEEGAGWGAVCVSSALKRNKKDAWWEQPGWLHCVTDCRCERAPAQSSFRHATAAQPLFTPPLHLWRGKDALALMCFLSSVCTLKDCRVQGSGGIYHTRSMGFYFQRISVFTNAYT